MSEHPSSQLLAQYMQRVLSSETFLKVHQHILSCPECSEKCDESQQLGEDYSTLNEALLSSQASEAPAHLSLTEVRAYINGELAEIDHEIAESHLQLCAPCRESVRLSEVESARGAAPDAASLPGGAGQELPSLARQPFFSFWHGRRRAGLLLALSASLILILLAGLSLIRNRLNEGSGTVTTVNQNNNTPAQSPALADGRANLNQPVISGGSSSSSSSSNENKDAPTPAPSATASSEPPAKTTQVIKDGGRNVALDERGNLYGLEDLPSNLQREIKEMILTGRARRPQQPVEFDGKRSALMSDSAGDGLPFRLLSPFNQVVPDNRPTLRWQPLSGAESYTVTVADAQLNQVSVSEPLKSTEWKITAPLKYGGVYSWQVTALKEGQRITSPVLPAPQAKFKVIDYDVMRELSQARRAYPNSHLTLAALYIRAGLIEQARRELRALVRSNPQSSTARSILRSLER